MTISGANSPEWFLADLGAVAADSVAVGVYPTNAGEAAVAVARDAETDVVVAEDAEQVRGGGFFTRGEAVRSYRTAGVVLIIAVGAGD